MSSGKVIALMAMSRTASIAICAKSRLPRTNSRRYGWMIATGLRSGSSSVQQP